jgi:hypothetical protein
MKKQLLHRMFLSCIMFFTMLRVEGQVPEIKVWLDSALIRIGEQVKLYIEINKEPQVQVNIDELSTILPGTIEVIGNSINDTSRIQDREIISKIFTITSFDSGVHVIPPVPVSFFSTDVQDTVFSNPVILMVYFPEVDTTQGVKDIKPLINTPLTFTEILPQIGIGAGALILTGLLIFLYFRLRKKKPIFIKQKESVPAHMIAFSELDKLKDENLWQRGKVKEFYIRLSDIIRIYLENRYNLRSMECVTDEILSDFRKVNQDSDVEGMLADILQISDKVKFAKGEPSPSENQSNLNNAYFFVEKTRIFEVKNLEELKKEVSSVDNSEQKLVK